MFELSEFNTFQAKYDFLIIAHIKVSKDRPLWTLELKKNWKGINYLILHL